MFRLKLPRWDHTEIESRCSADAKLQDTAAKEMASGCLSKYHFYVVMQKRMPDDRIELSTFGL